MRDAGAAGELTGARREWRFGDEQPLDVVRTVRNAVLRTAGDAPDASSAGDASPSTTSRSSRPSGAPAPRSRLLVDLSYSMALRGTWGAAKSTAMALHSLVTTKYPQDAIQIIGFSDSPRCCARRRWPSCRWTRCRAPTCSTG